MSRLAAAERADAGPRQGQIQVHASAVAIKESGVLIRGPSGAGKSSLALALIAAAGNARTFARLIGDDWIGLESHGGRLVARGHGLILGQVERRGLGILDIPYLAAAVVRLVIDLEPAGNPPPRYPAPEGGCVVLGGISVPLLRLPRGLAATDQALSVLQLLLADKKTL